MGAHFRLAFSRSVGCGRALRAQRSAGRDAGRAIARRTASRSRSSRSASRASICCSAATATTRCSSPEYAGDVPIVHAGPYGKLRFAKRTLTYDAARARFALRDFRLRAAAAGGMKAASSSSATATAKPSIAERIAVELAARRSGCCGSTTSRWSATCRRSSLRDVGPRAAMPSGGLIAMGNVRNIARDVRAGLLGLTLAQRRFLAQRARPIRRRRRGRRRVRTADGAAGARAGRLRRHRQERQRRAVWTVRRTAAAPRGGAFRSRRARPPSGSRSTVSPSNRRPTSSPTCSQRATTRGPRAATDGFAPAIALFPGSRAGAYDQAAFLLDVVARTCCATGRTSARSSRLRAGSTRMRFAATARAGGWDVALAPGDDSDAVRAAHVKVARPCGRGAERWDRSCARVERSCWGKPERPTRPPQPPACRSSPSRTPTNRAAMVPPSPVGTAR